MLDGSLDNPGTIPAAAFRVASMLGWIEGGVLPEPGGLNDQPAAFVQALGVASSESNRLRKADNGSTANAINRR